MSLIGIRTVFRQFDDMENLINAVDQISSKASTPSYPSLTIKTRLKQIVETRNFPIIYTPYLCL